MSLLRWSALLAVIVLAGCKKEEPAPSTPKTSSASKHAATGVGSAEPAATPPPAAGPSLSYLKAVDPERCEWVRQPLPSGEATTVFTFDAACDRSMASWSPNGKEGLVFTWPSGEGEVPKAWRVDFAARTGKPLNLKGLPGGTGAGGQDKPYIEQIGFDRQGHPVAIIADVYVSRAFKKGKKDQVTLTFEGNEYSMELIPGSGSPGLAHAYRQEGESWTRVETQASNFETDVAIGTHALQALKVLQPIARSSVPTDRMPGKDVSEDVAKKLAAAFPALTDETGQWMEFPTPGGAVYYRGVQGGEYLYPTLPMRWEQDGRLVELEGLKGKPDDFMNLQLMDKFLLIINYGDPRSAQIWDTQTKKLVFSAEGANAAAFWPSPSKP
jgi:hypothetical protein